MIPPQHVDHIIVRGQAPVIDIPYAVLPDEHKPLRPHVVTGLKPANVDA